MFVTQGLEKVILMDDNTIWLDYEHQFIESLYPMDCYLHRVLESS